MSKKPPKTNDVTNEEVIALAQIVSLYTRKRFDSAKIKQFGHLVSLLGKLTKQVYGEPAPRDRT